MGVRSEGKVSASELVISGFSEQRKHVRFVPLLAYTLDGGKAEMRDGTLPVEAGSYPLDTCFDGQNIWVSNNGTGTLSKFDIKTNTLLATLSGGVDGVMCGCFDGRFVYFVCASGQAVVKVDPVMNSVVDTVALGGPYGVGIAFDGTYLWVTWGAVTGLAKKIRRSPLAVIANVTVGSMPAHAGVFTPGFMWIPNLMGGSISKINVSTNVVAATISVASSVSGCFDGKFLWFCGGGITKVNPATNAILGSVAGASGSNFIAFDGTFLWAPNYDGTVMQIDPVSSTVIAVFPADYPSSWGICFDGTHIWWASGDSVRKKLVRRN